MRLVVPRKGSLGGDSRRACSFLKKIEEKEEEVAPNTLNNQRHPYSL
jgi:hypothetical protein